MSRPEPDEDGRDLLESGSLDLTFLRTLASDAAAAVACLWDSPRNTFWRSTEHRALEESKPPTGMFPTVTFRSLEALLQLIENYPAWADTAVVNLAVNQAIPAILSSREEDLRSTLGLTSEGDV